jgi:hypothetical protein
MKRYVEGENYRSQSTLFSESLNEYIADDTPVLVVMSSSTSWIYKAAGGDEPHYKP